jgi:hypothetical protein
VTGAAVREALERLGTVWQKGTEVEGPRAVIGPRAGRFGRAPRYGLVSAFDWLLKEVGRVLRSRITLASWSLAAFLIALPPCEAATVATDTGQMHGHIVSVHGNALVLRLRNGRQTKIDIATARASHHTGAMAVGGAVVVYGTRAANGVFHAVSIGHTNSNSKSWPPDD